MAKPLRTPERLFRAAQWFIALLLAFFLTSFSSNLIRDVPNIIQAPKLSDFGDQIQLKTREASLEKTQEAQRIHEQALTELRTQYDHAFNQYKAQQASFDHWRDNLASTQSTEARPQINAKTKALDEQLKLIQTIEARLHEKQVAQDQLNAQKTNDEIAIKTLREASQKAFDVDYKSYSIKIFLIRLALIGPLLVVGVLLFKTYRHTPQWPFVYGFIGFALWAFFFELLPYLPSFGGYIRHGVGVLLTLMGGRVLIQNLQQYIAQKQLEQQASQEERKQVITYDKAIVALEKDECPSCERPMKSSPDFIRYFCMHCGLKTHLQCSNCGVRHNAFYPYCPSCGTAKNTP